MFYMQYFSKIGPNLARFWYFVYFFCFNNVLPLIYLHCHSHVHKKRKATAVYLRISGSDTETTVFRKILIKTEAKF